MAWFTKFFNKEKFKDVQQRPSEPKRQDFTGVMQAVVEETIMASAHWLIGLVNTSLENKAASQVQDEEKVVVKPTTGLEELVPKVVALIEQFNDRSQIITTLESRIHVTEMALREKSALEQSEQVSVESFNALASRLDTIEALVKDSEVTQEASDRSNQNTAALEDRIAHLEKLLNRYSVVPKLIEQNRHAIVALQHHLTPTEFPSNNNKHSDREASPASFN
jgi:tetrahydromethanopterin S-methyltransferase subunit G